MAVKFETASSQFAYTTATLWTSYFGASDYGVVCGWFYPLSTHTGCIASTSKHDVPVHNSIICVNNGYARAQESDSLGAHFVQTDSMYNLNAWNFLIGKFDQANYAYISLNGSAFKATANYNRDQSLNRCEIGSVYYNGSRVWYFNGYLAHITYWHATTSDVMPTDADAARLANGMHPLKYKPGYIKSYTPLDSPSVVKDWVANTSWGIANAPTLAPSSPPVEYLLERPTIAYLENLGAGAIMTPNTGYWGP